MSKNLFITGIPGVGKTTLVVEVFNKFPSKLGGFYTTEVRVNGVREGFKICTTSGKEEIFAWKGLKSNYRVGSYGVNIKVLEEIGVASILDAIKNKDIILIDEIGKMECFSEMFKRAVLESLNSSKKVLATVKLVRDTFTESLILRKDTQILELTRQNYDSVKNFVLRWVEKEY